MNLNQIPKVELHRHLELSLRHSTIKELAPQFGFDLSKPGAFEHHFLIDKPMADLEKVLHKFLDTQKLLGSTEILERITYEACEDAYLEGIRLLELRYAPTFVRQGHDNLSFAAIHGAIAKAVEKAEKAFPMAVGLICTIQRILPVRDASYVTDFAIENKNSFVGLDLADSEVGFDCKPFGLFFERAKKAGLGITVHSGEANVPRAAQYVKDAIDFLGAQRIGHGVQIYKDPKTMAYVKSKNVVLELCPTSNWLTQAVPTLKDHPIKKIQEAGVKVTVNTDDPGIFGINLVNEYEVLHENHGFVTADFIALNEIAAQASFIPASKKSKVWKPPQ